MQTLFLVIEFIASVSSEVLKIEELFEILLQALPFKLNSLEVDGSSEHFNSFSNFPTHFRTDSVARNKSDSVSSTIASVSSDHSGSNGLQHHKASLKELKINMEC